MSQSGRSRGGPGPQPNIIPGVISAVVVLIVLGLLGIFLANRAVTDQNTQSVAGTEATPGTGSDTVGSQPTSATDSVASEIKTYDAAPPMTIDATKNYTATITTPRGDIVIKLRPDLAPQAVNNFVFLAREGFYDGVTWHRVLENFMAQTGDPTGTGMGGPGYTIPDEFTNEVLFDRPGIVAQANTGMPNSGGSQFFITTAPTTWLNGAYTIFGEVVEGQDIVNGIPLRDPEQNPTTPGEEIIKVSITEG